MPRRAEVRIAKRRVQIGRVERVESLERPERVEPRLRRRAGAEHRFERSDGRFVLPLKEQPLGRVAVPAVALPSNATSSAVLFVPVAAVPDSESRPEQCDTPDPNRAPP